jgi:cytoskeletal protein CcmA (bactofilin family)
MKPDRDSIHRRAIRLGATALVVGLGLGSVALAHELGDVVVISEPVKEDLYVAGESVEIRADVGGDLVVAGQTVTTNGRIDGDVIAAGESLTLAGNLRDDARVAARSMTLTGTVEDHVVAAGETVLLASSSQVGGFAWLAGNRVDVAGHVGGDLAATGNRVTISGTVGGNASIDAADAVIEPSAHIRGDLSWPRGHAPEIRDGARIDGRRIETAGSGEPGGWARAPGMVVGIIIGTLSLWLLTLVLRAVVPPVMQGAAALLRARPGLSLGVGVLALLVAPLIAALAFVTVVGVPLALVLSLAYMLLLVIGIPVTLDVLVDLVLGRVRKGRPIAGSWRLLTLAVASLVFVAVLQIPIVGPIVGLAALVLGLGALVLRAVRRSGAGGLGGPASPIATHASAVGVGG